MWEISGDGDRVGGKKGYWGLKRPSSLMAFHPSRHKGMRGGWGRGSECRGLGLRQLSPEPW